MGRYVATSRQTTACFPFGRRSGISLLRLHPHWWRDPPAFKCGDEPKARGGVNAASGSPWIGTSHRGPGKTPIHGRYDWRGDAPFDRPARETAAGLRARAGAVRGIFPSDSALGGYPYFGQAYLQWLWPCRSPMSEGVGGATARGGWFQGRSGADKLSIDDCPPAAVRAHAPFAAGRMRGQMVMQRLSGFAAADCCLVQQG
jgi:hypothetical protein